MKLDDLSEGNRFSQPQRGLPRLRVGQRITASIPADANPAGRSQYVIGKIVKIYNNPAYASQPDGTATCEVAGEDGMTYEVAEAWIETAN